jgi:hypothetical protein
MKMGTRNLVIHPDRASMNLFKHKINYFISTLPLSNKLLLSTVVILLKNFNAIEAGFNCCFRPAHPIGSIVFGFATILLIVVLPFQDPRMT